jgi:ribosomal protein S18 acetylase RimI-like enzyme
MLTVRPFEPADAGTVAALIGEAHEFHASALPDTFQDSHDAVFTPEEVAELSTAPDQLWLAAVLDDVVVGYLQAEVQRTPANRVKRASARLHVHQMGVTARARGRGIGRALLERARAEAVRRGLSEVSLEVYAFNAAARAFYEREGFTSVRELRVWRATPERE